MNIYISYRYYLNKEGGDNFCVLKQTHVEESFINKATQPKKT